MSPDGIESRRISIRPLSVNDASKAASTPIAELPEEVKTIKVAKVEEKTRVTRAAKAAQAAQEAEKAREAPELGATLEAINNLSDLMATLHRNTVALIHIRDLKHSSQREAASLWLHMARAAVPARSKAASLLRPVARVQSVLFLTIGP